MGRVPPRRFFSGRQERRSWCSRSDTGSSSAWSRDLRTASDEPAIRFEHVSKRYRRQEGRTLKEFVPAFVRGRGWAPEFHALRDVSFTLRHGETLGIICLNGSGKTTILRLI